ncbi:MAG: Spy/CpxP family protein refolding chaperone [Verrucomicrobiaceae bacterium]|nr:Spy/CpxP family protein refolding chaperone [Verrucomicrobiaceae bacterium]
MKHLALTLILTAATAFAAPEDLLKAGLLSPEIIQKIKPELELTAEQESKMTAIVSEAREKGSSVESAFKEQQKTLHQMLREPSTTADAASAVLTKVLASEGEVKHLQLRTLIALRDVLTPEQQKKAAKLSLSKAVLQSSDLEASVKAKANKLRAAVDALGEKPTEAMAYRGEEIETMIKNGDWTSADAALDSLIKDSGVNEPEEASAAPDFSTFEPGDTNLDALQSRFETVKERAQEIISIPVMRRMLKAKEAFETAKAAQDAEAVGRILTFAEKELDKK